MKLGGIKSYVTTILPKNIDTNTLTEEASDSQSEKC